MPRFNSEFSALRFPAYWLDRPVRGADRARKLDALARARAMSPGFLVQAYRGLRTLLLHGRYSGDDLAQLLAMHRRTLNRRLRDEGTTFQAVMDSVRFEVARQLLAYTDVGMDDIAASLGYASVSPFMRSFKRWSGMSPGQCRRRTLTQRRHDPSPSTQLAHVTSAHGLASTAPTGRVISSNRRPRDAEAGAF
jgi:AraC-like DNA-binding protein